MAVIWSNTASYPQLCDYCEDGCQCDSPAGLSAEEVFAGETPVECEYCSWGCTCGAEEWEEPGDGGYEERPDCECECECCQCECTCEPYIIDADSYNSWVREACYVCDTHCLDQIPLEKGDQTYCVKDIGGGYTFKVRVMPTKVKQRALSFFGLPVGPEITIEAGLDIYLGLRRARCTFTGPVMVPMLLGPVHDKNRFWMSLTPMEVFSLRPGINRAKGNVLIAGLGMGWMTNAILQKASVTGVTQVEICHEVASLFGEYLQQTYPGKFQMLIGNIWDVLPDLELTSYDSIIFDIWPQYGTAHMDRKFQELKRQFKGKVWGWGDY